MITLHYMGGPWDLEHSIQAKPPQARIQMPRTDDDESDVTLITHDYVVHRVSDNVYVAIYEDDML